MDLEIKLEDNKVEIRLPIVMIDLILKVAKKHGVNVQQFISEDGILHVTEHDQELLIEAVAAEFCAAGLRPDSEPSSYGLQLEDLLDHIRTAPPA